MPQLGPNFWLFSFLMWMFILISMVNIYSEILFKLNEKLFKDLKMKKKWLW